MECWLKKLIIGHTIYGFLQEYEESKFLNFSLFFLFVFVITTHVYILIFLCVYTFTILKKKKKN